MEPRPGAMLRQCTSRQALRRLEIPDAETCDPIATAACRLRDAWPSRTRHIAMLTLLSCSEKRRPWCLIAPVRIATFGADERAN